MPTLYETYPTRSQRVKWTLAEIGASYDSELIDMRAGQHKTPQYTAINPMQVVPTYQTPSYTIHESVAVVMQLIDENSDSKLAPAIGSADRAHYYQWCVFGSAEMDFPLGLITQHEILLPKEKQNSTLANMGRELFDTRATVLSKVLENQPYLLGETFTGADIVVGYDCFWATFSGLLENHPVLSRYLENLQTRPAFQSAFAET